MVSVAPGVEARIASMLMVLAVLVSVYVAPISGVKTPFTTSDVFVTEAGVPLASPP